MTSTDISIHPHVHIGGRRLKPPKNVCAPRSRAKLERALTGVTKHLEQHPRDNMNFLRHAAISATLYGEKK